MGRSMKRTAEWAQHIAATAAPFAVSFTDGDSAVPTLMAGCLRTRVSVCIGHIANFYDFAQAHSVPTSFRTVFPNFGALSLTVCGHFFYQMSLLEFLHQSVIFRDQLGTSLVSVTLDFKQPLHQLSEVFHDFLHRAGGWLVGRDDRGSHGRKLVKIEQLHAGCRAFQLPHSLGNT